MITVLNPPHRETISPRYDRVTITKPYPAKWYQVLLWVITFGKFGKTFIMVSEPGFKWHSTLDPRTVNCKCTLTVEPTVIDEL